MHSAVADVPRAGGVTPVSRALVDDAAVPPHPPAPPAHSTDAPTVDTLTGPDTAASVPSCARSATLVPDPPEQVPPAPCTVQDDAPVLLRTPATSPDAAPEVVFHPRPVQPAIAHTVCEEASLTAVSTRSTAPTRDTSREDASSSAREDALLTQSPSVAAQVDAALVSRTGAAAPATAGTPVTLPSAFAPASPEQPGTSSQRTLAATVLTACPSSSTRVSLEPPHAPPRATQLAAPSLVRCAPPVPLVIAVPLPSQAPVQSTSTAASADSSSASLRAAQLPPVTVQPALPSVADSVAAPRSTVRLLASPVVLADPEHPSSQSTSASATTVSSTSTSLDVRQLPVHTDAPPPSTRRSSSAVPALRTPDRSAPEPLLRLSHDPPAASQDASAPSSSARVRTSHSPVHRADAFFAVPSAPRLDALLRQPESSHDASDFDPPDFDDAPHPDVTPDRHSFRSESRSPSADSLTDPQAVNAPSESQPAVDPSPSRSSSDTSRTSRSEASISSSVAS
ncbi:hypothetical protein GCM10009559_09820 [Pseudonocardia zijingensis]|uniref:Uncharacterized protein n=1 Tax=Pseudonocardia zijingensis TaxID=153376 RepID=A0ABP3ZRJ7_9PSEU